MAGTRLTQTSFSRGELAPALYMRTEIEQYSLGSKEIKNGFIHQEGCVSNRSGFEFIGEVKNSNDETRLIPFQFNSEQTYIIEAGDKYFRFIQDGGYIVNENDEIYEIETPYAKEDLVNLKIVQSADILTITHIDYTPHELIRYDHDNWVLKEITVKPSISAPTGLKATWTGKTDSNTRTYSYIVTAVDKETMEEHFVSVPECGGGKLIPEGSLKYGHTYFIGRGTSGNIGTYKIEVESPSGHGKFTTSGVGTDRETKEALNTAFNYFKANKKNISATIQIENVDYLLHIEDLQGVGSSKDVSLASYVAMCSSALKKPIQGSMVILGSLTIGGTIGKVDELANTLQVCFDSGAKKILLPMSSAGDISTVPSDLFSKFNISFYNDPEDAVSKALGIE